MVNHRYQIIKQLGKSKFAHTYLARVAGAPSASKYVLKQLPAEVCQPWMLKLLEQEATILDRLHHNKIPQKVECFEDRGNFCLVQDFVEGDDLSKEFVVGCRWSEQNAIGFLREMLKILGHVHHKQAIHRDVKPANIVRRWDNRQFYLIDFGAVRDLRCDLAIGPTNLGTLGYHAPEQCHGQASFSSDIYALGMTVIQFLTGQYPQHLPRNPNGDVLWQDLVKVSDPLIAVLEKMTKRHVEERYGCTGVVLDALDALPQMTFNIPPARLSGKRLAARIAITSVVLLSIGLAMLLNRQQSPAAISEVQKLYNSKKE
jgi:eukaryotic-like serine/threonine-protein kinase